ncbi:MAG TPA: radical SAM protein [Dermatophilaceae bacterium]|nr:radical SAM protein [Dermatophilaceae bacterium]
MHPTHRPQHPAPSGHPRGNPGGHGHRHRHGHPGGRDFDEAPFLVIWETTQACDLACRHCRAEARPERDAGELSTAQARRLLEDIRRFGPLVVVLSGGDALKRPDTVELVAHGASLGLRMAITPATTPLCDPPTMAALKDAGLARLAVSLDGSTPEIHDTFRRVPGSFEHGLRILREAREVGLTTQVNTTVRRDNVEDMAAMCELMGELGIVFWEVFFLVPMGRARPEDVAGAEEFEEVFDRLYELSRTADFDIKATAAPQFNRVVLQHKKAEAPATATC